VTTSIHFAGLKFTENNAAPVAGRRENISERSMETEKMNGGQPKEKKKKKTPNCCLEFGTICLFEALCVIFSPGTRKDFAKRRCCLYDGCIQSGV
jgi:hypothetical protein